MEQLNQFVEALMPYVITIVTAIAGYVAVVVKNKIAEKINTQTKKEVVEATVKYVQQLYETLDGKEKFQKALETSTEWLNEKGIKITETEASILIEAAVKGFKEGWLSTEAKQLEVNSMKQLNEVEQTSDDTSVENPKASTEE